MRKVLTVLLLMTAFTRWALAGEIYGTIFADGKAVKSGVEVVIAVGSKSYSTKADDSGLYRVVVSETGDCTLTVHYQGQAPSVGIHSYNKSARYDLALEKSNGKYSLKVK